jgi:hypothetical protein
MRGVLLPVELRVVVVVGITDRVPVGVLVLVLESRPDSVGAAEGVGRLVGSFERVPVAVREVVRLLVAVRVPYAAAPTKKRLVSPTALNSKCDCCIGSPTHLRTSARPSKMRSICALYYS